MAQFTKILNHPDRDQIISKLSTGETSRDVAIWLKEKYSINKVNQIGATTLDEFRRKYLNLHGTILEDIQLKLRDNCQEELDTALVKAVKRNKTYEEKLTEFVEEQIDWRKKLLQFLNVVETRFSQLYDKTQNNPDNYKPDYVMIQWMNTILKMVEDIRKVEGAPDQVIQHNVTVQAIDDQAAVFQQAIQKTIAELDLNTASILIDKLNANIEKLKHDKASILYSEKDRNKITTLAAKLIPEFGVNND
jgi:hypothetical protein